MSSEIGEHVAISTTENSVGLSRAGFGTQAIADCGYATFTGRSAEYSDVSEMVADGMTSKTPSYRAAQKAFAQKPRPQSVKVLKMTGKPTLRYQIDVASVASSTAYTLWIESDSAAIADTTITYTSDASATNDEIVDGLVALINAIASKNFTASSTGGAGTLDLLITGNTAGVWFSVEIASTTLLKIECTHAEPATTIATDLDAINEEDPDWYGLTYPYPSDACVKACANWCEGETKIFVPAMNDSTIITTAASTGDGDTANDLKNLTLARTACIYHPNPAAFAGAAWMGRMLPTEPGRATWKFKALRSVENVVLTTTQRARLRDKNCNTYTTVATGLSMTWEGTTADGDFVDATRNIDWLDDAMSVAVMGAFAANDIIPMTESGKQIILNEVEGVLSEAVTRGILSDDAADEPVVTAPLIADISDADRADRILPDIEWTGRLAGAIHKARINGNVQV